MNKRGKKFEIKYKGPQVLVVQCHKSVGVSEEKRKTKRRKKYEEVMSKVFPILLKDRFTI